MPARRLAPLAIFLAACHSVSTPEFTPVVLGDDGGWCWFQDERALALGNLVVLGSVAAGRSDPARRGSVELTIWRPRTGELSRVVLRERMELDDHDAPALLELEDGRLLAVYARHGNDKLVRWRRNERAGDLQSWEPERSFAPTPDARMGVTYSNLHHGSRPGEVLDLHRGLDWDPNLIVSRDSGDSWEWFGRILGGPGRPYLKYTSDGSGAVHIMATEQHPRDFDNSIYHGVLRVPHVLRSDGSVAGTVGDAPPEPTELTCVFRGGPDAVAWPVDFELDAQGLPVMLFSVQVDGTGKPRREGGLDHRLFLARFDGSAWRHEEIGHLGRRLYAGEDDYTGLAALDPADPSVVYLSTDAHPLTGLALVSASDGERHRELFRARRGGRVDGWTFTQLTRDSAADNLRPVIPSGSPHVLLWLRGELTTYTDYALEIVGALLPD